MTNNRLIEDIVFYICATIIICTLIINYYNYKREGDIQNGIQTNITFGYERSNEK